MPEKDGITGNQRNGAGNAALAVPGSLFRGKREKVHLFLVDLVGQDVESAGHQHLADEPVELSDISFQGRVALRIEFVFQEFSTDPDPRQRRAQFMRDIGKQQAVLGNERLDPLGGPVETVGQSRHFVLALHLDAGVQFTLAEHFHAGLQAFQSSRETANDGICADRYRDRQADEQRKKPEKTAPGRFRTQDKPPPVGQSDNPGRRSRAAQPASGPVPRSELRHRPSGGRDRHAPIVIKGQVDIVAPADLPDGGRLFPHRGFGGRQSGNDHFADQAQCLPRTGAVGNKPVCCGNEQDKDQQAADDRQVDLDREPPEHTLCRALVLRTGKDITRAANGDDAAGVPGIVFDRRPDP